MDRPLKGVNGSAKGVISYSNSLRCYKTSFKLIISHSQICSVTKGRSKLFEAPIQHITAIFCA